MGPTKDEGFDEIKYEWTKGAKCEEYLKAWVLNKKQTTRVEDIKPSAWFRDQWTKFERELKDWNRKAADYKAAKLKKATEKKQKEDEKRKKVAAAKAEALKKELKKKKKKEEAEKKKEE